ncbi:MAG: hypothetical protein J6S97_07225 [Bacteroidales bacterium]|nr:hypothetical protein [Bacteroidales bacterium]MBP5383057.1 hypothetical protein [Bacteroidales bacterium]
MKIRNTLLLLVVSAVAAVSCNLFDNWDMDVPMGVDKHANLTPEKLFDVQSDNNLYITPAGDICLCFEATPEVQQTCTLESGKTTSLGEMTTVVDEGPIISGGADFDPAQILLTFDNPSDKTVKFDVDVEANTVTKAVQKAKFSVLVPAGKTNYTVLIKSVDTDDPVVNANATVIMDSAAKAAFTNNKLSGPVKFNVSAGLGTTKAAAAPAASAYKLKAAAKLFVPFKLKKGSSFTLIKTFTDLGLKLSDYTIESKEYDVIAEVTNSMPFEITGTGESVQGVTATINNPIAAGTKSSPAKTSITVRVIDNSGTSLVQDASIKLRFTAAENGARINNGGTLQIHYTGIKVHQF